MASQDEPASKNAVDLPSPAAFAELMALKRLEGSNGTPTEPEKVERFQSLAAPFPPGEGTRAFGGHVYAQSAYAASKTVEQGFVIHDMTGTFILPGLLDVPYLYTVRHLRDGGMYCTRAVDARQDGKICFSCLCSFKRDEGQRTFHHQPAPAQERFKALLAGKRPEDHLPSYGVDADWWIEQIEQGNVTEREFPGLVVKKVDMKDYNQTEEIKRSPEKFRQLTVYSLKGSPLDPSKVSSKEDLKAREQAGEFDNLYACAHMYSSDKNSLLLIPRALGHRNWTAMASLTLTVVFHQHGDALRMIDWSAASNSAATELPNKWFIQEGWTPTSGENRAIHESYLWSPEGTLIATSYQDSMLRLSNPGRERL
ncbi:acyl-CoA thioesterase [Aspergillus clavatus NRRL 1]|uniref:Acyl-CoA thioesterase n=1 Tax=Aspergillus clavatus (strain ATCC 1007 / CBS 513.65 / DSM 816 / NCTC 3887 / NRRL 1 / QM 1276 / 107) TaxID=344612 RepID=A1CPR6_ASPCL|nr:acyl-CoA thioesterase [Aspergillus clavatus NRRL 1]EAW07637.1 acyl-CoA thioesterase [Aspergillus clavatus NRRL 1]